MKSIASKAWNATKSAFNHATNWVSTQVNRAANWVGRQWNKVQTAYNSASDYVQQKYQQAAAQIEAKRQQVVRSAYALATGLSSSPTIREGMNLLRNWGTALQNTLKHVCTTAERVKNQVVDFVKNVDWKKVAVTAGAIGVGIALTVATGGLGAPVAMAIGGAASGAIISGYDAYRSGQGGWELVGSIAKGAGTGAISGLIGGQLMGAGASLATNVTQNIGNQAVRQVAQIGVESAVETAIDTGIDLATGNKITGQTVALNFAFNTFTNGGGSVSPKKAPKADVDAMSAPKNKTNINGEELATTKDIRNYKRQWGSRGIKVKVDKKGKILPHNVEAGFDNVNGVIYVRKEPTKINLYHEGYHAQQWLDIGYENYQKLTRVQREEYVFNEIMKNKHLFDDASIKHSIDYIERLRGDRYCMYTNLTREQVIEIGKNFHSKNKLEGECVLDSNLLKLELSYPYEFENMNYKGSTLWFMLVKYPPNNFLFEDYTLVISDSDAKVVFYLDVNGHPKFFD